MKMTSRDLRGLFAIIPTPAKAHADRLDATDTVDLAESERVVNALIKDGVNGLIALGTTGECATLSRTDYNAFVECVLATVNRRVPTFIGTTALGGHEVVDRTRFVRDRGADGILLGMPMWQPLVMKEAVEYYREMSELFSDTAIMIYANARAFRFQFVTEFWQAVANVAPTVCAAKHSRPAHLAEFIAASRGHINFVPHEGTVAKFYEIAPDTTTACWATAAAMGPAPAQAIIDAILRKDAAAIETLAAAIAWTGEPVKPITSNPDIFASFNIQLEKTRINEAGYCLAGPMRPPYDFVPDDIAEAARECGRRWARLCRSYTGNFQFTEQPWLTGVAAE
jgi:dihydrodipicolinate synthase/N-acetylneuraminate lyase